MPVIRAQPRPFRERLDLEGELDERLDREALDEAFADLPPSVAVERIRKALGLPPEETANDPERTTAGEVPPSGPGEIGFDAAPQPPLQRFGPS